MGSSNLIMVALAALLTVGCVTEIPVAKRGDDTSSKKNKKDKATDGEDKPGAGDGEDEPEDTPGGEQTPVEDGPRKTLTDFPGSKIFKPAKMPAPTVVMLHGSEGGSEPFIQEFAQEVAQNGFLVMTMCWFGCPGKSDKILRIPVESIIDAGKFMRTDPNGTGKVGLFGWSRGAELSLLVGSLTNTDPFSAIAVHAPSDTIVGAFDPATQNNSPDFGGIQENGKPAAAWTWQTKPLFGEPKPDYSVPGPKIEVTKYKGPVYVSHGETDDLWEVARGKAVVASRKAVQGLVTESHFFPGQGHVLQGTAETTQHKEVIAFMKKNLAP